MNRTPFFAILAILLLGAVAAAIVGVAAAQGLWAIAGVLLAAAILWLAWGPDAWWTTRRGAGLAFRAAPALEPEAEPVARTLRPVPARTPPAVAAVASPAASTPYQPQCSALRNDGVQCRNSARGGSKYCGSHVGYQPRTAEGVVRQTDTASKVARRDTPTSYAGDATADTARGAQCQALTAAGGGRAQCKNTVRPGSQFCVAHAGYRSPTPRSVVRGRDSRPRWAKAPDTLPSTRKSSA